MKWKIGNIEIKNQVVLAPMAGISDAAYFKICENMGVGYAITELISSEAIIRNNRKTFDMLNGLEDVNFPFAVQLFGSNPEVMAKAAKILVDQYNVKIIDVNMGCPVPKVALRSSAGAGLMKDVDLAVSIVKTIVGAVNVPVTVKIRSGWDVNNINAVFMAKQLELAGAACISIHARTRSQGYSGTADWSVIKQVKDNVKIPVIGNGDIKTADDALKMLDHTGCDAVMIGRAAMGNPWLLKNICNKLERIKEDDVTITEKIVVLKHHFMLLNKYKGEKVACMEIRNHANWYFKGVSSFKNFKVKLYSSNSFDDIMALLDSFMEVVSSE